MKLSPNAGRFLLRKTTILVGTLLALAVLLFLPHAVSANPMVFLKIEITLTENGLPYNRPARLTSNCYLPEDFSDVYQSESVSCLHSPCILIVYSIGSPCDLRIERVDGEDVIIEGYVTGRRMPGAVIRKGFLQEFKLTVDIANATSQNVELDGNGNYVYTFPIHFVIALAMTLLVEVSVLLIMKYVLKLSAVDVARIIIIGCMASLITLPLVWFIVPRVWSLFPVDSYVFCVLVTEFLVVIFEARFLKAFLEINAKHALWMAFLANMLSFLLGVQLL